MAQVDESVFYFYLFIIIAHNSISILDVIHVQDIYVHMTLLKASQHM